MGMPSGMRRQDREDVWVIIPTYDEADTIGPLVEQVRSYGYLVLVVDDSPNDATVKAADEAGAYVIHRQGRKGLASAIIAGMKIVAKSTASYGIVMDAGGTHRAEDVPVLLMTAERFGFDVVIGSRFMGNYRKRGWRTWLSRCGTLMTRLLGVVVTDATCGFRCYRIDKRLLAALEHCQATGHAFQFELLTHLVRIDAKIGEVGIPYQLVGRSSLKMKTVQEALITWARLMVRRKL